MQQDALWNSVEVIQSRNRLPAGLQTHADVISLPWPMAWVVPPTERASRAVLEELAAAIQAGRCSTGGWCGAFTAACVIG